MYVYYVVKRVDKKKRKYLCWSESVAYISFILILINGRLFLHGGEYNNAKRIWLLDLATKTWSVYFIMAVKR